MSATAVKQAQDAHTIQAVLAAQLIRDVTKLWPLLDRKRLDATFPDWLQLMIQLVTHYHDLSATAAGIHYADVRAAAVGSATAPAVIQLPPAPSVDWMTKAFGYSGPALLKDGAWQDSSALTTTQGTAVRIAQSGGRDTTLNTVKADRRAVGFYRVTDGSPCAFCALLASRGVVAKSTLYRSAHSFDAANAKFEGPGVAKVHNFCGCTMAPAFSRSDQLPDVNRKAAEVYVNRGDGPALAAFRKAWNEHLAASAAPATPNAA